MKFISKEDGLEYYTHDDVFYETYHEAYESDHNRHDRFEHFIGKFKYHDDTDDPEYTDTNTIGIYVYSHEGDRIPHMHFKSSDGKLDGCVKIEKAEHYVHESHTSKLTKTQAKEFYKFMLGKSRITKMKNLTNWELAII